MNSLFLALFLLAIASWIVGAIKPSWVKLPTRKSVSMWFGGAVLVFFIGFGVTSSDTPAPITVATPAVPTQVETSQPTLVETKIEQQPTVTKAEAAKPVPTPTSASAQKKLADFMAKAKEATLVTSYEFSDTATVVYVGPVWYTQTATQKKDFMAYVANLKKDVTGYRHFEIHDAYSDEKVAEVTSFSGALKVYK